MNDPLTRVIPTPDPGQPSYAVRVGAGLLAHAGATLRAAGVPPGPAYVITQPLIARWLPPLIASLCGAGFTPEVFPVDDGEGSKSLDQAKALYRALAGRHAPRSAPILALGGGVVGDLAGFVAATWKRGVPLLALPTTLLAMVDGSIGGKTALHLDGGKNLIGAFKFPLGVLCDVDTLSTLPEPRVAEGLAEALKHGVIGDPALFETLEGGRPRLDAPFVHRAMGVKASIVGRDPLEGGERAQLNLGHTLGHALETLSAFDLSHGAAVGLGMLAEARLSYVLGRCDASVPARIAGALAALSLPVTWALPEDLTPLFHAIAQDKKHSAGRRRYALPSAIGRVEIVEDPPEEAVVEALRSLGPGGGETA